MSNFQISIPLGNHISIFLRFKLLIRISHWRSANFCFANSANFPCYGPDDKSRSTFRFHFDKPMYEWVCTLGMLVTVCVCVCVCVFLWKSRVIWKDGDRVHAGKSFGCFNERSYSHFFQQTHKNWCSVRLCVWVILTRTCSVDVVVCRFIFLQFLLQAKRERGREGGKMRCCASRTRRRLRAWTLWQKKGGKSSPLAQFYGTVCVCVCVCVCKRNRCW
jgi:hypothetical protein